MKKKVISVMMAAMLLVSLGGCGKEPQQQAEADGTVQKEASDEGTANGETGGSRICVEPNSDM